MSLPEFFIGLRQAVIEARYLWLPVILFLIFWGLWLYYIRARFISKLDWTLLEIKLPREITKSPKAMEIVLNMLHQTRDGNLYERYWLGWLRAWFSLEIASINGEVRFFIYTQRFFRNLVEAQIYAQYPDVEITEVDDYTKMTFTDGFDKDWGCWGTEFDLTAEDAYPIKTYVDYGLHELATKEEQKNDPITSMIEFLGSLKEGEQVWLQILVRATKKDWKEEGKKLVDKIMKEAKGEPKEGEIEMGIFKLTPGQTEVIKAIERDVSKLGFDVGIRVMYLARKDKFNNVNKVSIIGVMKQFNALNLNGFKPVRLSDLDYQWQLKKIRDPIRRKKILDAFRQRSYFYPPYDHTSFILNTEELATIFHFPGRVAETPTLGRIEAKKGEPPPNLPI
ncbi:MAG: hypothetical protein HY773_00265 [Candidatus Terrybacteria bacterium]|nr:hypothetical protein [Candidatus Terrybacteria bacterium]